ncbi:MAG: DNA polymerase III subunit beta [Planctomycetota bacterium]|nr:DNA polymerase III subunit beta [Planctomycetota bacterium]
MKVICDRGGLLGAINLVSRAVAGRTPRVQLTCIKLTASKPAGKGGGELVLSATDAEVAIKIALTNVDVQQSGEALVLADKLKAIVAAEDAEPTLTIEVTQEKCHIRGRDAHFTLLGYAPADFPPIPDFADVIAGTRGQQTPKTTFTQLASGLAMLVERTIFATARETSRYAINGVLLKRDGRRVEMVATDGRRLALCRGTVTGGGGGEKEAPFNCIIPSKALSLIRDLARDPEETVAVAVTDNQAFFAFGSGLGKDAAPPRAVLISNLVEGTFPPYEDVIPKDSDRKVVFDRDLVKSAVSRAALLTNEESRGVRMRFSKADKQLELSSRAPEMGEAELRVDLRSYEGEDLEIGFNPLFITDALKVIQETEVVMELKDAKRPGVVRSGNDFLYVVMPVSLA